MQGAAAGSTASVVPSGGVPGNGVLGRGAREPTMSGLGG